MWVTAISPGVSSGCDVRAAVANGVPLASLMCGSTCSVWTPCSVDVSIALELDVGGEIDAGTALESSGASVAWSAYIVLRTPFLSIVIVSEVANIMG